MSDEEDGLFAKSGVPLFILGVSRGNSREVFGGDSVKRTFEGRGEDDGGLGLEGGAVIFMSTFGAQTRGESQLDPTEHAWRGANMLMNVVVCGDYPGHVVKVLAAHSLSPSRRTLSSALERNGSRFMMAHPAYVQGHLVADVTLLNQNEDVTNEWPQSSH